MGRKKLEEETETLETENTPKPEEIKPHKVEKIQIEIPPTEQRVMRVTIRGPILVAKPVPYW